MSRKFFRVVLHRLQSGEWHKVGLYLYLYAGRVHNAIVALLDYCRPCFARYFGATRFLHKRFERNPV